ncbi:LuxR C-terminal-related transcriptional regulator [Nocardia brasiliensis]|uniref:LuxR C-terminal-related transcriptional regulator n=1 Tax=Nocardia brasiliensis TaxID=37326 RepID=UPI002457A43C|nr:LuxR C-terminal-related transcriptional regulator [Nocardia brasiliensis]
MSEPLGYPAYACPALSPREKQVLLVWLRCDSKAAAARTLYLSVATVNTHIARIRAKYAAAARPAPTKAALFARAIQDNLVTLDEW